MSYMLYKQIEVYMFVCIENNCFSIAKCMCLVITGLNVSFNTLPLHIENSRGNEKQIDRVFIFWRARNKGEGGI